MTRTRSLARRALGALLAAALLLACAGAALASGYNVPGQKLVALTFDDGPGPYSGQILDVLSKHGAKATFFMNGYHIKSYPDQVRRMAAEGHQVANHTYDHPQLTKIDNSKIRWEIDSTAELLTSVTGLTGTGDGGFYLRAPYGDYNSRVSSLAGVPMIFWSVDSEDWRYKSASRLVSYVGSAAKDGDIVLMHESQKSTASGLDELLTVLDKKGFKLVTVEDLLWRRGVEPQPGTTYSYARNNGINRCDRALWYDESHLERHWAYDAINYVADAGVMPRNEWGEFLPNLPLARRDIASSLARLYHGAAPAELSPFEDVPPDDCDSPYVAWAWARGVMAGVSDTRFEPERGMTRQELAVVLARCARLFAEVPSDAPALPDYLDADQIAGWARDDVAFCAALGIFQGDGQGCFRPDEVVTRAMGATVLERLGRLGPAEG